MNRFHSFWASAALLALATVLLSFSANAGFCQTCIKKSFNTNIGKCVNCGAATASEAFKLCPACSPRRNQCAACRAALLGVPRVTLPVEVKPAVSPVENKLAVPPVGLKPAVPPAEIMAVVPPATQVKPAVVAPAALAGK